MTQVGMEKRMSDYSYDEGCCLDCDDAEEGCWCDECVCKECLHYEVCDCGNGRGYCSLVNDECSECRGDYY